MKQLTLRQLKREQLLEMMLQQQQTIEEQERIIQELTDALHQKELMMAKAGSIAEASLLLNGVFEAAQQAADQYLASLKATYPEGEESCQE